MYPVSTRPARTSFLCLVAALFSACSGADETTHTIRIAPEVVTSAASCEAFDGGVLAPNSIIKCQSASGPLFATLLEDCSIPEKFTFQATTRQLLVGMTGMNILSQAPVSIRGEHLLHSVVRGAIDAEPVLLATFTKRSDGCVSDLVLWQSTAVGDLPASQVSEFTASSRKLAELLVPPANSKAEPAHVEP